MSQWKWKSLLMTQSFEQLAEYSVLFVVGKKKKKKKTLNAFSALVESKIIKQIFAQSARMLLLQLGNFLSGAERFPGSAGTGTRVLSRAPVTQ